MAAYPTSPAFKSTVKPASKLRLNVTESGKVRASSLAEEDVYRIEVIHPLITSAEVNTLQSFYTTNRYSDNTITASDGDAYDCWFESDYEIESVGPTFFNARTTLIANRQ